ncbi:hypothetical protein AVEN_139231-1 [Araneus ventricosus]|uniref:Transposase Tc1-like domain-containing protein n=1 Tax=Araneus ventricosus TaxID=182803 RepID=A0A4Y2G0K2_ARAVE|nr:hypothetical protein AVEN_139231-1 [Araneus ventricosus]
MMGSIVNKRGRDIEPKASIREDSTIVRLAQKKNDISSREIMKDLEVNVSDPTVHLSIKNSRLISCIQTKDRASQNKTCLAFAKEHLLKDSRTVFYSQTKANISFLDKKNHKRVWQRSGERLKQMHTLKTVKHGGRNVMVWGCFSSKGVGEIVMIDSKITVSMSISCPKTHVKDWSVLNQKLPFEERKNKNKLFSDNQR